MNSKTGRKGRPPLHPERGPMRPVTVRLDHAEVKLARRLGDGNLSHGVRKAVESRRFKKFHDAHSAAIALMEAYDLGQDVGPSIERLVTLLRG